MEMTPREWVRLLAALIRIGDMLGVIADELTERRKHDDR